MDPLLKSLAAKVSRSFALTLFALPARQRDPIAITYLLARFADTLSDGGRWELSERVLHLERWENCIAGEKAETWRLEGSLEGFSSQERDLLTNGIELLTFRSALSQTEKQASREVLTLLIAGMKWDLQTFSSAHSGKPVVFGVENLKEFHDYCFTIAGCVGAYWVRSFQLPGKLSEPAVAYGKGLQRINILRDVKEDWERGRVYLPREEILKYQIDLQSPPWLQEGWKKFTTDYIQTTRVFLEEGAAFCNALPYRKMRLRYASVLPLAIGWKTLDHLQRASSWETRIKVSRPEIKRLAAQSLLRVVSGRNFPLQKAQVR